jgi:TRAP-type mannitol/chloroaromatic compound transport system permease small subunit
MEFLISLFSVPIALFFLIYVCPVLFARNYTEMYKRWEKTPDWAQLLGVIITIVTILGFVSLIFSGHQLTLNSKMAVVPPLCIVISFFVIYIRSRFK